MAVISPLWRFFDWFFDESLAIREEMNKKLGDNPYEAWKIVINIWEDTDCLFGSMVGRNLEWVIENEIFEAFISKFEDHPGFDRQVNRESQPLHCGIFVQGILALP